MIFQRCFNAHFCKSNEPIWLHVNEELSNFNMPTYRCETGTAIKLLQPGYRLYLFLYVLDELFHVFKQLREDDFNAQSIVVWEILHIAQHHCTEWCRGEKVMGHTLGDAYFHVDFWDVAGLEQLTWAIYDGAFILGRVPELSGYQDWDCIVAGILIP